MNKRILIIPFCTLLAWCASVDGQSVRRSDPVPASSYFEAGMKTEKWEISDDAITEEELNVGDSEAEALEDVTDGDVEELVNSLFDKSVQL